MRTNENDLWQYCKFKAGVYPSHYLESAFNELVDFADGKETNKDMVMSHMMESVKGTLDKLKTLEEKCKRLEKYNKWLQDQFQKLLIEMP